MSVVLSKRGSSKFEVIDNAMNIRKKLTQYILHDFAITDEMTESEKWFLNSSREVIVNRVRDLKGEYYNGGNSNLSKGRC